VSEAYFSSLDLKSGLEIQTIKVLENIGHAPFLEHPDMFNQLLLDFCKTCFSDAQD